MFCHKCGNEIMDEAMICPKCGCATVNYGNGTVASPKVEKHSGDWEAIKEYASKARTIKVWGIISFVLCLGIGVIPGIITFLAALGVSSPVVSTTNRDELDYLAAAQKNYEKGKGMALGGALINAGIWIMAIGIWMNAGMI